MKILLAGRDRTTTAFLRGALKALSCVVNVVSTIAEVAHRVEVVDYDLIILALGSRVVEREALKYIRRRKEFLPILVLAHRASVEDRAMALDLGADDYMTQPFAVREFLARLRVILRRTTQSTLRIADLELDRVEHTIQRADRRVELTPKEFALLEYLVRNAGKNLSRAMISKHVWGVSFGRESSNVVDAYINYVRKKVDYGFDQRLIHTVRGVGYRIGDPDQGRLKAQVNQRSIHAK